MNTAKDTKYGGLVALLACVAFALAIALQPSAAWADGNVAKIGDTEYATLAEAVSAAEDGDTITLVADTSVASQIKITGKSITLDLNGCTLTLGSESNAARMLYVNANASLTVTDSGSGGTITNDGFYSYGLIDVYGTLVIEGGTFYDSGSGDGASIKGRSDSTIIIYDGTFEVAYTNYNDAAESDSGEIYYSGNTNYFGNYILRSTYGYVSITGGTFTAGQNCWGAICLEYCESASSDSDIVSVSGIEVTCTASAGIYLYGTDAVISDSTVEVNGARTTDYLFITSAIAASNGAEVTIESGTYSAPYAVYVWSSGGIVTIEDGDFTGTLAVLKADAVNSSYYGEGESSIIVYDGTFDGEISIQTNASSYIDASLIIYHGDFTSDEAADYVVSTYTNDNGETVYTALTEETDEKNGTTYQLVHALVAVDAVDATCTEDGNVAYYVCTYDECGSCFLYDEDSESYVEADYGTQIAIAATGHDYVLTESVEATCTEDGYATYTCSACGDTYTETIEATGHTWANPSNDDYIWSDDYSGCTLTLTCSVCGTTVELELEVTSAVKGSDTVYTATATYEGITYTQTKTVTTSASEDGDDGDSDSATLAQTNDNDDGTDDTDSGSDESTFARTGGTAASAVNAAAGACAAFGTVCAAAALILRRRAA